MQITDDLINYVSGLSKLDLSAEEKDARKKDLEDIVSYIEKLNELDTENVAPYSPGISEKARTDVITNKDDRENLFKNAPEEGSGFFTVMRVIND
jgi:aspartyl-tRNA(Asn)/glutamyl-tRNA(Gln) amidotransferase subunit C